METKTLLRILLPLALGFVPVQAAVLNSDNQGFLRMGAPANTDTLVSPALGRPAVWAGTVSSVSGNRIAVSGSPGWTTDQFAPGTDTWYVRPLTGALRGYFFTVASNNAGSLLVDSAGLNFTQFTAGDKLELAAYATLISTYPASQAGVSFVASASTLSRQTEIYFYDPAGTGINRAPSAGYFFYNGAWRKIGGAVATSYNNVVIPPDTYILQRNKAAATTLTQLGRVHPGQLSTLLETPASGSQDNYAALAYPQPVTLRNTGLGGSAAFATSTDAANPADQLLMFDPAQTGINRLPAATYFYFNSGWRKSGASIGTDFSDTVTLTPGSGFIVRRAATGSTGGWTFDTGL